MWIFGSALVIALSGTLMAEDNTDAQRAKEALQRIEEMKKMPLPMSALARERFDQKLQEYEAQIAMGLYPQNIRESMNRANELHRLFNKVPDKGDAERISQILDAQPIPYREPVTDILGPSDSGKSPDQPDKEVIPEERPDLHEVIGEEVRTIDETPPSPGEVGPGGNPSGESGDRHESGSGGGGGGCPHGTGCCGG